MKTQSDQPAYSVNRPRLYAVAIAIVPLFMALMLALAGGSMFIILRSQTKLVQIAVDQGFTRWQSLDGLPGYPEQLVAAADGSLWVRTQMWGSLAHYRNGGWETYQRDTFGTRKDVPRHDFAVVGNQVWAAIDDRLVHFDGQGWRSEPIPRVTDDYVVAASENTVWILGNDGLLRTRADGKSSATNLGATVPGATWKLEKAFDAPRLLAAADGSLWFCGQTVWRGRDDAWAPVEVAGCELGGGELLGYAGGRLWFHDGRSVLWVADNAKASGGFTYEQLGLSGCDRLDAIDEIGGQILASGSAGIYVLHDDHLELKWRAPEGVCRCPAVAGTNATMAAIAVDLTPIPALWLAFPVAAMLSGAVLWAVRKSTHVSYAKLVPPNYWRVIIPMLVIVLTGIAPFSVISRPILLMVAPIGCAMLMLLAPPLVMVLAVHRDFIDGSLEIIRYRPVTTAETPETARRCFERDTAAFLAEGFELVGDFRLKQRSEHFARVFLNSEQAIIGEINWTKTQLWQTKQCCSFASLTDDLTYLETGNLAIPAETFEGSFILNSVPGASVADTLQSHRSKLDELAERRQTIPVRIEAEDIEKVSLYGQKLSYARLKQRGVIRRNPYEEVALDLAASEPGDPETTGLNALPLAEALASKM